MSIGSRRRTTIGVTYVLSLLTICFLATQGFSQTRPSRGGGAGGGPGGGNRAGMMIDRINQATQDLNLTDDQKAKLEPIFSKARQDMQAAGDLDPQERMGRMREIRDDLIGQVKGVLTDDQKKTFDEKMAAMPQGGRGAGGGQGQGGGAGALQRLRDAAESVGLSDEQKSKIETAVRDAMDKVRQAREEAQGDMQVMREKAQAIRENLTTEIRGILTPEQQEKFREAIRNIGGQGGAGGGRRGGAAGGPSTAPSTQPSGAGDSSGGGGGAMAHPPDAGPERLEVGQAAPDFHANKLDGLPVQLASFKDKYLLLTFGSYSSPSFRQRAAALEELRREFGVRLDFLLIYTREAHPAGAWDVDRNHDSQINVADHKNENARRDAARTARDQLKLRQITFATDTMDDAIARAYFAWPNNAAVLVAKDGTVLTYQKWFEPYAMREAIVAALTPSR